MRLIGDIEEEKQAYLFYSFLSKKGIESSYEPFFDPKIKKNCFHIWILDEDYIDEAQNWLLKFREDPSDPQFTLMITATTPPPPTIAQIQDEPLTTKTPHMKVKVHVRPPRPFSHPLNNFLIAVCIILFFWNAFQEKRLIANKGSLAVQIISTPLQEALLFDYPQSMEYLNRLVEEYPIKEVKELKDLPPGAQALIEKSENTPTWKGIFSFLLNYRKKGWSALETIPLFEKIRQGEVWRLVTPTLLHRDFLHIFFNMAWLWILGSQIEKRAGKIRMLLLILVVAVVSNVAQYLVSGPFFLGFSGVVVGMAGFIWSRQKKAPWEGYPLNRATVIFILLFVLAMFLLEIISLLLRFLAVTELTPSIANTAHIMGGLTGMLLGRFSLFSRGGKG